MAILMFDRMRAGSRAALLAMALTAGGCMLFSQLSPREAPLAFNHAFHIEQGLECADCHAGVESGAEPGMPTSPQCMLCHENQDRDKPPEKK